MERTYEGFLKSTKSNKPTPTQEDIRTCFLDLIDDGFSVVITYPNVNYKYEFIEIYKDFWFGFNSIKETLLFAIPYLSENYNFTINTINVKYSKDQWKIVKADRSRTAGFLRFYNVDEMCEFFNKHPVVVSEVNISFSVDGVTKNVSRTSDGGPR